jgi:hypothetical protein
MITNATRLGFGLIPLLVTFVACSSQNSVFPDGTGSEADGGVPPGSSPFGPSLGDGGAGNPGDGGTCASSSKRAEVAQLDLVLLLDTSGSMLANEKWKSMTSALQSFVVDPRVSDIGLGISFFPKFAGPYTICDEATYANPDITVAPLDQSQALYISTTLDGRSPLGGTPMGPAVQGALRFARSWQQQNPNRKVAFVLATDGLPDESCQFAPPGRASNTLAAVRAQATAASTQSIPTYVIGVGTELTALNDVAQAGATGQAIIVDPKGDTTAQLVAAFDKIRRSEIGCEYGIPAPDPGQTLDLAKVNVRFVDELGYVDFLYVSGPDKCSTTANGWYFDNPVSPTRILLCDPFCGEVKASRVGRVDVLLGCTRNEAPIR